jgi:hypothetical protein
MSRANDNVQMYWPHVVATILFAIAVWKYVSLAQWELNLKPIAFATFGFVCVVASHEVADWTGRYGWTYQSFWTYPPTYVQFFGFVLLVGTNLFGFS